jgi:hypothetical protein
MANRFGARLLLPLAAIGLAATLGGCVAYPAYPAYPAYGYGYGYGAPYYGGAYVGIGGGGWRGGHDEWHDHDGGWRR